MVAIPRDKINYDKVSKYANVLIFKKFYPKTENVSYMYYLKALKILQKYSFPFYIEEDLNAKKHLYMILITRNCT